MDKTFFCYTKRLIPILLLIYSVKLKQKTEMLKKIVRLIKLNVKLRKKAKFILQKTKTVSVKEDRRVRCY